MVWSRRVFFLQILLPEFVDRPPRFVAGTAAPLQPVVAKGKDYAPDRLRMRYGR